MVDANASGQVVVTWHESADVTADRFAPATGWRGAETVEGTNEHDPTFVALGDDGVAMAVRSGPYVRALRSPR